MRRIRRTGWTAAPACLASTLLVATALGSAQARAQDAAAFAATTLSLSATGEVRARPNLATVNLGVQAQAPFAAAAFAHVRDQMNAIFATLRTQGVAETDIRTSGLELQAEYTDGERGARTLSGYRASNTVSIRLHDLGRVGAVVDALVAAGANQVDGISFELADPTAAEDAARELAVKSLQAKADLYARAAGYRIRRLINLSEGGTSYSPSRPLVAMRTMAARTPVSAGETTVSVSVSAQFELTR